MAEKLTLGPVRCTFPSLHEPKKFKGAAEGSEKYGIKVLIPKNDKVTIKKVVDHYTAAIDAVGDWKTELKKMVKDTAKNDLTYGILKDGDAINAARDAEGKSEVAEYAGHYVLTLSRKSGGNWGRPTVVGPDATPIPQMEVAESIRSGFYVNVSATCYTYSKPKAGVTYTLQGVQLVKPAEEFVHGGNDFTPIESTSDGEDPPF